MHRKDIKGTVVNPLSTSIWHYANSHFEQLSRVGFFRNKLGYNLRPGDFILNCFSSSLIKPSETASRAAILEPGAARPGTEAAKLEQAAPKVEEAAKSESAASMQEIRINKNLIENSNVTNAESMPILQDQSDQLDQSDKLDQKVQQDQRDQPDQRDQLDSTDPLNFKGKVQGTEQILHMVSCNFFLSNN